MVVLLCVVLCFVVGVVALCRGFVFVCDLGDDVVYDVGISYYDPLLLMVHYSGNSTVRVGNDFTEYSLFKKFKVNEKTLFTKPLKLLITRKSLTSVYNSIKYNLIISIYKSWEIPFTTS